MPLYCSSCHPPGATGLGVGGARALLCRAVLFARSTTAGCPSGQWERTVNPSALPSKVRILHPPLWPPQGGHSAFPCCARSEDMLASSELSKDHISDRGRNAEADDVSRVCRLTRAVRPPGITCRGGGACSSGPTTALVGSSACVSRSTPRPEPGRRNEPAGAGEWFYLPAVSRATNQRG